MACDGPRPCTPPCVAVTATPWTDTPLGFGSTHTRSYTTFAVLVRSKVVGPSASSPDRVVLHVVGADLREGRTPAAVAAGFSHLVALLAACGTRGVTLWLTGPNTAVADGTAQDVDVAVGPALLRAVAAAHLEAAGVWCPDTSVPAAIDAMTVTVCASHALYHEEPVGKLAPPHAVLLFNAGVWGYDSWLPTLRAVCRARVPCVVTSYNGFEASDDEDAVVDCVADEPDLSWVVDWVPGANPFASDAATASPAPPFRTLVENGMWMCVHGT